MEDSKHTPQRLTYILSQLPQQGRLTPIRKRGSSGSDTSGTARENKRVRVENAGAGEDYPRGIESKDGQESDSMENCSGLGGILDAMKRTACILEIRPRSKHIRKEIVRAILEYVMEVQKSEYPVYDVG
ncbi:hypothetical protein M407DRAFT_246995 [Tulasnella calospora MUT 4182]|uniref:Uncharacterized protein n=1 Tax=Tulasnella calospora MUT 4182 TaxID=1051891 RepID=A0A0C3L440_9AGAM|nr:hypothetical protein M407DRAFT_246995 [Tulasnella calospora MUT 4182]